MWAQESCRNWIPMMCNSWQLTCIIRRLFNQIALWEDVHRLAVVGASKDFCELVQSSRKVHPGHFIQVLTRDGILLKVIRIHLIIAQALWFQNGRWVLHSHPHPKEIQLDDLSSVCFIQPFRDTTQTPIIMRCLCVNMLAFTHAQTLWMQQSVVVRM